MRTVTIAERRVRLGRRHLLASPAGSPLEVANALVALHATDPATVYLSCLARLEAPSLEAVHRSLHSERCLVRMLGMRRTVFAVDTALVPVVEASSTRKVAAVERRQLVKALEAADVAADGNAWVDEVAREVEAHLETTGGSTAVELAEAIPALNERIVLGPGTRFESAQRANSRVLLVMAAEGRILRGETTGAWTGTRYRWVLPRQWLGEVPERMDTQPAQRKLARRWLRAFGPATLEDLTWWTGWTLTDARRAVGELDAVEVDMDGEPGLLLPDDLETEDPPEPWVALLPALDPTPMGWKRRHWYLGDHREAVFDSTGNIGPTVWVDGCIVGAWAHRRDGSIVIEYLEDVGPERAERIRAKADHLTGLVAGTIVVPRFRSILADRLARG